MILRAVKGAGVDISSKAIAICKRNLKELGLYERTKLYKSDAVKFVQSKGEKFDVIFMDPPYSLNISSKVFCNLSM